MDFAIPESTKILAKEILEFIEKEVYPLEKKFLSNGGFAALLPELKAKRKQVKENGWWVPYLPKEYGGMGLSLMDYAIVSEELGKSPLGHYLFNCQAPDVGNIEILMQHGNKEQKEKYLFPLIAGEIRSCFSMTEPDTPGSNPVCLATTAEKSGEDYIINGRKWFTSSAQGASFAIVMAVTDASGSAYQRASQIIVPTETAGFKFVRNISVMGHVGEDYWSHAEILYENCCIPQSNRIGAEGDGFRLAQERLGPGRIHHCMRWIGICERAFDLMCQRAVMRDIAPDNEKLAGKQIVQQWIAQARCEIDAARLMVLQAAWKIENEGNYAAKENVSLIKFYVAQMMMKVLDAAIQVHGALGVTDETPLAFFYRSERAARIYDGPDEVHQMSVAKSILSRYKASNKN